MENKLKNCMELLTPSDPVCAKILEQVLDNPSAKTSRSFSSRKPVLAACALCFSLLLSIAVLYAPIFSGSRPPVFSMLVSNDRLFLQKSLDTVESAALRPLPDSKDVSLAVSASDCTVSLSQCFENGSLLYLIFDVTLSDDRTMPSENRVLEIQDLNVECQLTTKDAASATPVFEWYLLKSENDPTACTFGVTLWNDVNADTLQISVSDLAVKTSTFPLLPAKTIPGPWEFILPSKNPTAPAIESTVLLSEYQFQYQNHQIEIKQLTRLGNTLTLTLTASDGCLNKQPFVDEIPVIHAGEKDLYPAYGSASGDGTLRTLVYELEASDDADTLKSIQIGGEEILLPPTAPVP